MSKKKCTQLIQIVITVLLYIYNNFQRQYKLYYYVVYRNTSTKKIKEIEKLFFTMFNF